MICSLENDCLDTEKHPLRRAISSHLSFSFFKCTVPPGCKLETFSFWSEILSSWKSLTLSAGVRPICRHSIAFLPPSGVKERKEKQVMWDWRLKYFINQCCSQCVVWWLVENSGNPSFPTSNWHSRFSSGSPCIAFYFFISRVNLGCSVCVRRGGVGGASTLSLHLLLESVRHVCCSKTRHTHTHRSKQAKHKINSWSVLPC